MDKPLHHFTRLLEKFGGLGTSRMDPSVYIGVGSLVVAGHGVNHNLRLLRGRSIIKIGQSFSL